ncbi:MAG: phosphomannomutase/phosphoglucomutase [Kiritimatiellae bacterium]|nr:phosphomannomutase/phosphoglucomutase [Kiritimatiellia bacterium]
MGAFHAYDIRGVWGVDLDADTGYRVGRCLPSLLGAKTVLVGRDARVTSPELAAALARGVTEAGADVDDLGLCTTPTTYFVTGTRGYDAAAMVTASHNPPDCNGIKISKTGALPVGENSGLRELEAMVSGELPPKAERPGAVRRVDAKPDLLAWFGGRAPDLAGLRFVVDCSNGVGALLARDLFAGCGGEGVFINEELDGTFPNHPPNPLLPEASVQLGAAVVREGADLGLMFDGDADRVAFVDSRGKFVRPDVLTAVLAERFLADEPGAPVLCDIRTSRGVAERIAALGGAPHLWKVGHAYAKPKMRELAAPCGGELAGHYYFREFCWCDSAMRAAQIVLGAAAAAKRAGSSFDAIVRAIDVYANSGEVNFRCGRKDEAIAAFAAWAAARRPAAERTLDFDGVRVDWPDGWANVRKSNTEPYLRLVAEGRDAATLDAILAGVKSAIAPFVEG